MQLLRDNLTLWTSSDSGEPEGAAVAGQPEAAEKKDEEPKTEEPKAEEQPAAAS